MSTYPAALDLADEALRGAENSLSLTEKDLADEAATLGYLDVRQASEMALLRWWKCRAASRQRAAVFADLIDDTKAQVVVDLSPLRSRLGDEGIRQLRTLFREHAADRRNPDGRFTPAGASVVVLARSLSHVARQAARIAADHSLPEDPATAATLTVACDRCERRIERDRTLLKAACGPLRPRHESTDLCADCAREFAAWLRERPRRDAQEPRGVADAARDGRSHDPSPGTP